MMTQSLIRRQRDAALVREVLQQWPACEAHLRVDNKTGECDLVLNERLHPDTQLVILRFAAAWRFGFDRAVTLMQGVDPFRQPGATAALAPAMSRPTPAKGGGVRRNPAAGVPQARRHERAEAARAALEALFADDPQGANTHDAAGRPQNCRSDENAQDVQEAHT